MNKNYVLVEVYEILRKPDCKTSNHYFRWYSILLCHVVALRSRVLELNYINTQCTHMSLSLCFPESLDLCPQTGLNPGFGWRSFPRWSTAINRTVNLRQQLVLSQTTRRDACLQNEPIIMDGLYLCGENDTKMWFFNFRSSKICLRLNPPKVTVLTVKLQFHKVKRLQHVTTQVLINRIPLDYFILEILL